MKTTKLKMHPGTAAKKYLQISANIYRTKDAYGKKTINMEIESHLERLPKGEKALEWLKGLKLGWGVAVGNGQGGHKKRVTLLVLF